MAENNDGWKTDLKRHYEIGYQDAVNKITVWLISKNEFDLAEQVQQQFQRDVE